MREEPFFSSAFLARHLRDRACIFASPRSPTKSPPAPVPALGAGFPHSPAVSSPRCQVTGESSSVIQPVTKCLLVFQFQDWGRSEGGSKFPGKAKLVLSSSGNPASRPVFSLLLLRSRFIPTKQICDRGSVAGGHFFLFGSGAPFNTHTPRLNPPAAPSDTLVTLQFYKTCPNRFPRSSPQSLLPSSNRLPRLVPPSARPSAARRTDTKKSMVLSSTTTLIDPRHLVSNIHTLSPAMASSSTAIQAEAFPDGTTDFVPLRGKKYDLKKPRK